MYTGHVLGVSRLLNREYCQQILNGILKYRKNCFSSISIINAKGKLYIRVHVQYSVHTEHIERIDWNRFMSAVFCFSFFLFLYLVLGSLKSFLFNLVLFCDLPQRQIANWRQHDIEIFAFYLQVTVNRYSRINNETKQISVKIISVAVMSLSTWGKIVAIFFPLQNSVYFDEPLLLLILCF